MLPLAGLETCQLKPAQAYLFLLLHRHPTPYTQLHILVTRLYGAVCRYGHAPVLVLYGFYASMLLLYP